jgi:hypothetical protein
MPLVAELIRFSAYYPETTSLEGKRTRERYEIGGCLLSHKPHLKEQPDREIRLLILRGLEAVFWEPF